MSAASKLENPFTDLMYAVLLVLFGLFALLIAWAMWRSIDSWLILTFALVSFATPAFAALILGVRRLVLFVKFYSSFK